MASSFFPSARYFSAQRTTASATSPRTAGAAVASAFSRALAAASPPMRPSAAAAAAATSASASPSRATSASTALASRRTPIELITPISRRPFKPASAFRSASSQAGSGIASKAIRAQEESSSSDR